MGTFTAKLDDDTILEEDYHHALAYSASRQQHLQVFTVDFFTKDSASPTGPSDVTIFKADGVGFVHKAKAWYMGPSGPPAILVTDTHQCDVQKNGTSILDSVITLTGLTGGGISVLGNITPSLAPFVSGDRISLTLETATEPSMLGVRVQITVVFNYVA